MPVKSLESFLFERGVVGSCSFDNIRNCRLGIDVDHYISRVLTHKTELFTEAIGGDFSFLKEALETDLTIFKEFDITPVFVFNGFETSNQLDYALKVLPIPNKIASGVSSTTEEGAHSTSTIAPSIAFQNSTLLSMSGNATVMNTATTMHSQRGGNTKQIADLQRTNAWIDWVDLLKKRNADNYIDDPAHAKPVEPFKYGQPNIQSNKFQSELIKIFIDRDIPYMVAPFVSWIQLSYLLETEFIDAVYGSTDLLMAEKVDRFITKFDVSNREIRYVERSHVLKEFEISFNEFVDIAMCCGNSLQPVTLPPLDTIPEKQAFSYALELCSNQNMVFYYNLKNTGLTDSLAHYEKGLATLECSPVMFENGHVELYSTKLKNDSNTLKVEDPETKETSVKYKFPKDVHEFIIKKLPHEYYFYLSIGLFSNTKMLNSIITNEYIEELPLGSKNILKYHDLVQKNSETYKSKQFNLLTSSMNRYYQSKPIKHTKWFEPQRVEEIPNKMYPTMFEKISSIVVKTDEEKEFNLLSFISLFKKNKEWKTKFFTSTLLFPDSVPLENKLNTSFDLLATSLLRFLFLLGFFEFKLDSASNTPKRLRTTKWGDVLLKFNCTDDSESLESQLLLLLLMKQQVIRLDTPFDKTKYPTSLSSTTEEKFPEETQYINLLTRLLLLCKFENKSQYFPCPVDYSLLCFRDFYENIFTCSRELLESCVATSLVHGEFNRVCLKSNKEWMQKIVRQMFFQTQVPNTSCAVMWELYLQKCLHNPDKVSENKDSINNVFDVPVSTDENISAVLQKGSTFLKSAHVVFKELARKGLIDEKQVELLNNSIEWTTQFY